MDEIKFVMNIKFGTVESQSRFVPVVGGMAGQSRRIERDRNGVIESTTDWEDTGVIVRFK